MIRRRVCQKFGADSRSYRKLAGLSIRRWAEALDVNKDTVMRWERGEMPDHPKAVLLLMEQTAQRCAAEKVRK